MAKDWNIVAVLRGIFGTDAEMNHPKTRAEVQAKFKEAHEAIDHMRESSDRLAKVQRARNLDEALRQIVGE